MDKIILSPPTGEMQQYRILYVSIKAASELYDDDDNYVGIQTERKLFEVTVPWDKVYDVLHSIDMTAADAGDGITDAKLLCIVDAFDNSIQRTDTDYYKMSDDDDSGCDDCTNCRPNELKQDRTEGM